MRCFFFLILLVVVFVPPDAEADSPVSGAGTDTAKGEGLSVEYVDIRNGFSLRPPAGGVPFGNVFPFTQSETPASDPKTPTSNPKEILEQPWPGLANWDVLKVPASKELIRFVKTDSSPPEHLVVCLLVVKKEMDMEQMLAARRSFWQKYPNQAAIQQTETETEQKTINAHPVAGLTVVWQGQNKDAPSGSGRIIRESLIQNKEDRYFLLTLVCPVATGEKQSAGIALMDEIVKSFVCLGKTEEDRRWKQARKQAQYLLSSLGIDQIKKVFPAGAAKSWYEITFAEKKSGFICVTEQQEEPDNQEAIKISFDGFVSGGQESLTLARTYGWWAGSPVDDGSMIASLGAQRLQVQIVLEKNLQTERFDNRFTAVDNSQKGYHEQAERKTNILTIKRFDPVGQTDKFTTEKLEINSDIYLPWALEHFLGRLLEKKIGGEYVFMVYNNRSLCYHCLRVADRAGPTAENSQANAIYLIGQRGAQGPVVETWLDENGRMLKRRSGDMVIERSSEEKIKQLWPEEFKQK